MRLQKVHSRTLNFEKSATVNFNNGLHCTIDWKNSLQVFSRLLHPGHIVCLGGGGISRGKRKRRRTRRRNRRRKRRRMRRRRGTGRGEELGRRRRNQTTPPCKEGHKRSYIYIIDILTNGVLVRVSNSETSARAVFSSRLTEQFRAA